MGSCVSLHHKEHQSAMKLSLSVDDKVVLHSPVKPPADSVNVADVGGLKSNSVARGFPGSKEEAFFDSQPWIDSDCEDDFYSVNGGKKRSTLIKSPLILLQVLTTLC